MPGRPDQARAGLPREKMNAAERHVGHGEQRPDTPDRRDPGSALASQADRSKLEAKGSGAGVGDGALHRQHFGRSALIPGNYAFDVEIGHRGARGKGVHEGSHVLNLGPPGRARQQIGRRE